MSQIKRKIGATNYTVPQFRDDMHLLWKNAQDYNADGSWVYNAAEDMKEFFDEMWEKEHAKLQPGEHGGGTAPRPSGGPFNKALGGVQAQGDDLDSIPTSGSSTPMLKPASVPKIKLSLGGGKRKVAVVAPPPAAQSEDGSDDSDMDDDY
jgi:ATP-dependent helicase STH1/SNF2